MNTSGGTAPRRKHIPVRTCVVCRQKAGKRALTRIVRTTEGIFIDLTGRLNGRGAYLCDQAACWDRALHGDVLEKALKTRLTDDDRMRLQQAVP